MESSTYLVEWNGEDRFEVNQKKDRFIINFDNTSCTYRRWDLTGIPCVYVVRVVFHKN